MLDVNGMLTRVWNGQSSSSWQVFRAKRAGIVLSSIGYALLALFFVFFCGIFSLVAAGFYGATQHLQTGDPFQVLFGGAGGVSQVAPFIGVGIVAIVVIAAFIGAVRAAGVRNDPLPTLIIAPEGFIEYVNSRKPVQAVAFAELADLRLRIQTTRTTHYNQAGNPAAGSYTTTSTSTWLDLIYRDGKKGRWKPRARFGRPDTIIQGIIAAHARFVGAYRRP